MKKVLSFFAAVLLLGAFTPRVWGQTQYYDFSATASSGQTLYCNINDDGVSVCLVHPNYYYGCGIPEWGGFTKPSGNLIIPSAVTNNGTSYTVTDLDFFTFLGCSDLTTPNTYW